MEIRNSSLTASEVRNHRFWSPKWLTFVGGSGNTESIFGSSLGFANSPPPIVDCLFLQIRDVQGQFQPVQGSLEGFDICFDL